MHCNVVNNNYQQVSKVLFTFVHDKQFGQLFTIALRSLTMLKTADAEFSFSLKHVLQIKIKDHLK